MNILVTGGAGFIGSHIAEMAFNEGHFVGIIDNLSSGRIENIDPHLMVGKPLGKQSSRYFEKGDIVFNSAGRIDCIQLRDLCSRWQIDTICHQAAQPSLRKSIDDPVFDAQVNIIGTLNVIKAAEEVGAHLVFASTSAVYDPDDDPPYIESDCIKPNLPYGIAKASAEMYIRNSGLSYTILRYGNVYGPRQVKVGENQLIPHCLGYLLRGEPFVINGDGKQVRDFVYVNDIARANLMAMEKRPQGTFNCSTGDMKSVNTVCYMLADMIMKNGKRQNMTWWVEGQSIFNHGPAKPGEMRSSGLNSQKAFDTFGWRAETSLIDGLRMTYEWAKEK